MPQMLKAYFRHKDRDQCELCFKLKYKNDVVNLNEDICAVRQATDSVFSLLYHIQNKINKTLQIQCEDKDIYLDIPICLKRNAKPVKPETILASLLQVRGELLVFEIFDQFYHVIPNAPLIKYAKLPPVLYTNCSIAPVKFSTVNTDRSSSQYRWYKSMNQKNWTKVGDHFRYKTQLEDIGYYLKLVCIPKNCWNQKGPVCELISEKVVQAMLDLPECPFEKRHQYTKEPVNLPKLRIVSYNVLSERYTETNFPYCSEQALAVDYRKQLIYKELAGYNSDIICLQEVDSRLYNQYYREIFGKLGYYSFYNRKGNRIPEGLAIFFNAHKFRQRTVQHFVLTEVVEERKDLGYITNLLSKNKEVKELFMKQATSLQVATLFGREPLIVANTHLFYHWEASHIRLLQISIILTILNSIKKKVVHEHGRASIIFCGDFNSRPDSSIYELMTTGQIARDNPDCLKITDTGCKFFSKLSMISVCGTPKYTNYTLDFKGCLDYIFVEKELFDVVDTVPLPDEELLSKFEGLPNEYFPSDHLALVADLRIK